MLFSKDHILSLKGQVWVHRREHVMHGTREMSRKRRGEAAAAHQDDCRTALGSSAAAEACTREGPVKRRWEKVGRVAWAGRLGPRRALRAVQLRSSGDRPASARTACHLTCSMPVSGAGVRGVDESTRDGTRKTAEVLIRLSPRTGPSITCDQCQGSIANVVVIAVDDHQPRQTQLVTQTAFAICSSPSVPAPDSSVMCSEGRCLTICVPLFLLGIIGYSTWVFVDLITRMCSFSLPGMALGSPLAEC